MPDWLSILIASATGLLVFFNTVAKSDAYKAVTDWVKFAIKRSDRKELPASIGFRQVRAMQDLAVGLEEVRAAGSYARVNAIVLHNGGGDVTDSRTAKHVTVFESAGEGVKLDSRKSWVKADISEGYQRDIISKFHLGKPFIATTAKMGTDNELKAYYETDGIVCGVVAHATTMPGAVWYISLNSKRLILDEPKTLEDHLLHSRAFEHARQASNLLKKLSPLLPKPEELYK